MQFKKDKSFIHVDLLVSDINVEPNEEGVKLRCADIILLLSLKHGDSWMNKHEIKQKSKKRNTEDDLVFGSPTDPELYRRCLNQCLSRNIKRGYIESDNGEYSITDDGIERVNNLIDKTKEYLED